jgi:hypothetical protein
VRKLIQLEQAKRQADEAARAVAEKGGDPGAAADIDATDAEEALEVAGAPEKRKRTARSSKVSESQATAVAAAAE